MDDKRGTAIVINMVLRTHYVELKAKWMGPTHGDINILIQELVTFANVVTAEPSHPRWALVVDV